MKPPVDVLITATKRLRCSSLSLIPTFFVDLRLSWSYVLIPATSDMWQPDFVTFMILVFAALDKYVTEHFCFCSLLLHAGTHGFGLS